MYGCVHFGPVEIFSLFKPKKLGFERGLEEDLFCW